MATNYPKYLLPGVFAAQGDFVIPPANQEMAGDGRLSVNDGWGTETSIPIEQGGVPPRRDDFNGALYYLSQFLVWYQQGGLMNYSSSLNYEIGNEVLLNGVKYRALKENGPASKTVSPGTDPKTWKNMDANVPAGAVVPFANVTLGGSDGRRPIFWGQSDADEGWVFCDGGSSGISGVSVPDLRGRSIKCSTSDKDSGQTGGQSKITLGQNQIPAHSHTITIAQNGDHSHTRGTMNITGQFRATDRAMPLFGGAFYESARWSTYYKSGGSDNWGYLCSFDASRSWTGSTSTTGNHTHTATCSQTGSNSAEISTESPFYTLAYFVKLPE